MVWQQTKRRPTTCLRSTRLSVGDQCPQAARIVNQDVLARRGLWSMPPVPWEARASLQMSVRKYLSRFGSC